MGVSLLAHGVSLVQRLFSLIWAHPIEIPVMPEIDLHRRHGLQDRPAAVCTSISLTISPNCERPSRHRCLPLRLGCGPRKLLRPNLSKNGVAYFP